MKVREGDDLLLYHVREEKNDGRFYSRPISFLGSNAEYKLPHYPYTQTIANEKTIWEI